MEQSEYENRVARIERWWEEVRKELVAVISDSPPVIIYHYTEIDGLLGMVTTGKIWATHASRLNDTSEYHHGIGVVLHCVRNAMQGPSKPLLNRILSEFKQAETYVTSYSTKHDLLSQWRSYSGEKVGYCLGLATDGIATIDDSTPLLEPAIYKDSMAQQVISQLVRRVNEYLQSSKFGEVEAGYLLGIVGATLANLACTIKHPKFEEENEYRQFYQPGATSLELEQKFRNGRFGLTPYVEVPFRQEGRLPLKSVTIGPCTDVELEIVYVRAFLEKHAYQDVEVLVSEIPIRR